MKGATAFKPICAADFEKAAARSHGNARDLFRAFVVCWACALSMGQRESEYLSEAGRWSKSDMDAMVSLGGHLIDSMERRPYEDLLGPIHMEMGGNAANGEFYTPRDVSRAMAKLIIGDSPRNIAHRPISFHEPACGSGGMVLASTEHLIDLGISPRESHWVCVDVAPLAVNMCFINCTLWGIPADVIHGNALTAEQWAHYRTVHRPVERAEDNRMLDIIRSLKEIESQAPEPTPEPTPVIVTPATIAGQLTLFEHL